MEDNYSVLDDLSQRIKERWLETNKLLKSDILKKVSNSHHIAFLAMIDELKDSEKEQSRLDWKEGYINCCLDVAEFFGNERNESYPNDSEMEEIEQDSLEYIKRKFKK